MPKGNFDAKGFSFEARTRSQGNKSYLSSSIVSDQKFISYDPNKESIIKLKVNLNSMKEMELKAWLKANVKQVV